MDRTVNQRQQEQQQSPPNPPSLPPKKKRRLVADQDRKRAARACDNCRNHKEKCDGGVPCRRCVRLRRQCVFYAPSAKDIAVSRIQLGDEGDRATSRSHAEAAQRIRYMEKLIAHYTGATAFDTETLKTLAEDVSLRLDDDDDAEDGKPVMHLSEGGSPGSDYPGVDEENFTVQPLENNITHYSGEFSHWNFSMRIKRWIEDCVSNSRQGKPNETGFKEYYRAEELQSPATLLSALSALPPRYVAEFLAHVFFKHAETNYWYVDRAWLLARLDTAYTDPAAMTHRDVATLCVVYAVLAVGTQYAHLESPAWQSAHEAQTLQLQQQQQQQQQQHDETASSSEDAVGVMFYQQACRLLSDVITVASLESVQACLLLGLYALPLDASGLSYIYLNLALKLAIQNGMHRKYPGEAWNPVIRETRNRVWWATYTTERRVGIFHGRPLSIPGSEVDAEWPQHRESLPLTSSASHTAHVRAVLQLHQRLALVAKEISNLRTLAKNEVNDALNRVVDHTTKLTKWWQELPRDTFCTESSPNHPVIRNNLHLKIEYCLVRMFAGRPFIFTRDSSRSSTASSVSPAGASVEATGAPPPRTTTSTGTVSSGGAPSGRDDRPRARLVKDCVEAALTIVDTCQVLRNTAGGGLARASYTEFSGCRAALLVILTQCIQTKRSERLRRALREGMTMMKIMSAGGESARSEMSLIEALERAIARLDEVDEGGGAGLGGDGAAAAETDYTRFKKWEMLWKHGSPGDMTAPAAAATTAPMPNHHNGPQVLQQSSPPLSSAVPQFDVDDGGAAAAAAAVGAGMAPFFGTVQDSFGGFPQTMGDFSSMFGDGFIAGPGDMGAGGGGGGHEGNMWLDLAEMGD